jgi:hypothetical protein
VLGSWSPHLAAWLRNQGFFSTTGRVAITGTVSINGKPVSWGAVAFTPVDTNAARPTARVMGGKFKLDASNGAALGKTELTVTYSAADVPGLDTDTGTATQSAGIFEIKVEGEKLTLELHSQKP